MRLLYKGKPYEVSDEAAELAELLGEKWNWGDDSIAAALGLKRSPPEMEILRSLPGRPPNPEMVMAIDIAMQEGWSIGKVSKALSLAESQISLWLLFREEAIKKIKAAARNPQELLTGLLPLFGLRPGEMSRLKWGDVDFASGRIRLRRGPRR